MRVRAPSSLALSNMASTSKATAVACGALLFTGKWCCTMLGKECGYGHLDSLGCLVTWQHQTSRSPSNVQFGSKVEKLHMLPVNPTSLIVPWSRQQFQTATTCASATLLKPRVLRLKGEISLLANNNNNLLSAAHFLQCEGCCSQQHCGSCISAFDEQLEANALRWGLASQLASPALLQKQIVLECAGGQPVSKVFWG